MELENRFLRQENASLEKELADLRQKVPDPAEFAHDVTLDTIDRFLDRAGYVSTRSDDGSHIRLEFTGRNASFGVTVQHFAAADVVFLATSGLVDVEDAQDSRGLVLLLIQLAALNYEMLLGKFQLNPETGEILLSSELHVGDGLGYETFVGTLDHLLQTADSKYVELERAAAGLGL